MLTAFKKDVLLIKTEFQCLPGSEAMYFDMYKNEHIAKYPEYIYQGIAYTTEFTGSYYTICAEYRFLLRII